MRRRRAVWKDVAEMAAAAAAMHLRPGHAMASILGALKGALDGIVEAWPAGATLEFLARHEKPLATARADKSAGTLFMDERAASRSFRAMPAHDPVLFLRKQAPPFLIGMGDVKCLVLHHLSLRWAAKHALHIKIGDAERVFLDEFAAGLDDIAHQLDENILGVVAFLDLDLQ